MEIFRLKKSRDILSLNMRNIVMINDQTTQASNTTSICHGEIKSSLVRKEDSARIIFIRSHLLVMRKNNMHSFLTFLLLSLFLFIFSGYPFFFFALTSYLFHPLVMVSLTDILIGCSYCFIAKAQNGKKWRTKISAWLLALDTFKTLTPYLTHFASRRARGLAQQHFSTHALTSIGLPVEKDRE